MLSGYIAPRDVIRKSIFGRRVILFGTIDIAYRAHIVIRYITRNIYACTRVHSAVPCKLSDDDTLPLSNSEIPRERERASERTRERERGAGNKKQNKKRGRQPAADSLEASN